MNQSEFMSKTDLIASVVDAVIEQVGGWDEFILIAKDVAENGGGDGTSGFNYHEETNLFVKNIHFDIVALIMIAAVEAGSPNALALASGFKCFKGIEEKNLGMVLYGADTNNDDYDTIAYGLAVYALEEVAHDYQRLLED